LEPDDKCRMIIDVLIKYGEVNITKIARLTGLHYHIVAKKLQELQAKGVVEERRFGRLRLFRLKGRLWGEK